MPYQIQIRDGIAEVTLSGETSVAEVLQAVGELRDRDPRKEGCDLWEISEECVVPIDAFPAIAGGIKSFCPNGMVGNKTAFVANSEFQKSVMDMYRSEARKQKLPFEIGVFTSRDEAVRWLKS